MLDYENLRTGTGGSVRAYSRDDIADTIEQMDARKDHPHNDPNIVVDDAELPDFNEAGPQGHRDLRTVSAIARRYYGHR